MLFEQDQEFLAQLLAPVRQLLERPPESLGPFAGTLLHGTTIGAFIVGDGQYVVAFSDGKVSMGSKPVHLNYRKIFKIDRRTRMLISGSPVLGMAYAKALRAWIGYLEDTSGQRITARAKIGTLSNTLFRGIGLMGAGIVCAPIIATYDAKEKKRARIWDLGAEGSEVEQTERGFCVGGSGATIEPLLNEKYPTAGGKSMSIDAGVELARRVIDQIPKSDSFSGGKVSIDVIGPNGTRLIS